MAVSEIARMAHTLFSLSHFSKSCFRPCWSTGFASSNDSRWLSSPFSSKIPKYWRIGERPPGGAGACLKDSITALVRRIPLLQKSVTRFYSIKTKHTLGELAATFAASPNCPDENNCWYCLRYKSSAPGRLARLASLKANSVLFRVVKI